MHVWLVKLEENLPIEENARLYRIGMLAEHLVDSGHEVTWWCSTINHGTHTRRFDGDREVPVRDGYRLRLLHSNVSYTKAVSASRVINNQILARKFSAQIARTSPPDLIYCTVPTPELAYRSVQYGLRNQVPVLLDARDMWPDVISDVLSPVKKLAATPILWDMSRKLRWAARHASGIIGVSEEFRDFLLRYAGRGAQPYDGVFPLGFVDDADLSKEEREEGRAFWRQRFGISRGEERFTVLFAGRLNQTIRVPFEHVLHAARQLGTRSSGVRFVFCGDGDCSSELRESAKGLENVFFSGHVGTKELWAAKEMANVALLPVQRRRDHQASLTNKVFEYLSAGLPIVSHLTGTVERMLRCYSCGFCYDDGEQLIDILQKLRDDTELCHSMSHNARRLFLERFSAEVVYPALVAHLERLVKAQVHISPV